jgi:putative ABC transport system permease protein
MIYAPNQQQPSRSMTLVVRTTGNPEDFAPLARSLVRALDPQLPLLNVRTMRRLLFDRLKDWLLMDTLMAAFAGFALLLTAIGIYGVIAYAVGQRRQEIGVRIALGATSAEVVRLVLRKSALLVLAGVGIGMPLALAACRLMSSLLFGVNPFDAAIFTAVPFLLLAVALCASYLPARSAARVDPLTALRSE